MYLDSGFLVLGIEQIELWASDCSKAAIQLIFSGLFPEIVPQSSPSSVCLDPCTHCGCPLLQVAQEECDEVRTSGMTSQESVNKRVEEEGH